MIFNLLRGGLLLALSLMAAPLAADETPLTAEQFDALTLGKTLPFSNGGFVVGTEQYLPGRQVIWSAFPGDCKSGEWYQKEELICFQYEDSTTPVCWMILHRPEGISTFLMGNMDEVPMVSQPDTGQPLSCPGVGLGV